MTASFNWALGEFPTIEDVDIKLKCKDFFSVELRNDIGADHFSISSYANLDQQLLLLRFITLNFIHINDVDINHLES